MGLNALKINSCVPILVMCWFEEKIDARTDNLLKNRTFEEICAQTTAHCKIPKKALHTYCNALETA